MEVNIISYPISAFLVVLIWCNSLAGQVHRASLKGQEAVVKVQRPGLKELFDIDLKNLRVSSTIRLML